jgi:hypothetical protein
VQCSAGVNISLAEGRVAREESEATGGGQEVLRMAETEEIVIPPETDGEPLPPPKPRKPHVKGIVFRDFDVRAQAAMDSGQGAIRPA